MKRTSILNPWLVGCLFVLMCGFVACNKDEPEPEPEPEPTPVTPAAVTVNISTACQATDADGNAITSLALVAGQTVTYCNQWTGQTEVKFSVPGFVPGGTTMTLAPGECVTHVVESAVVDGDYSYTLTCEGYAGPGGGGPVKVDNPPPGP